MASVSDVYNQLVTANATLTSIHNDGVAVRGAVDGVHTALDTGFGVLTADLQVIATIEHQIDQSVLHLNQQTDSVLCILEQIAVGVCTLVNQGAEQVKLLKSIAADQHALREMYETVNPGAALTEARAEEVNAKIEQCCKTQPGTPPCLHQPCPTPPPLNLEPAPFTVPQYPRPNPGPRSPN
ncbi:hypothetical protein ACIGW8_26685 [Streptomyces sioyaensis]|uniref:hypothetical protein n=1 Tax=Streptomyces sioyaensis TaxID=67364 RepID=UPI0037D4ED50